MGDRIHPSLETEPLYKSVAVHIPDQSLFEQDQKKSVPPLHPQDDARTHRIPESAAGKRRRRSRCCCCLISFSATITSILLILGITALVLWLVLKPKAPRFTITDASISSIRILGNVSSLTANAELNVTMAFTVEAENPNTKIGFYYGNLHTVLFYEDQDIGKGSIPDFYHGHRNITFLDLQIVGNNISLSPSMASSLNSTLFSGNNFWLEAQTHAEVRIKIGSWKSKDSKVQVNCDVEISNPTTSSTISIISKTCKFKLKSLGLL